MKKSYFDSGGNDTELMLGLIHMKRSSLASLPCRSVLVNPDSMRCLQPILKNLKVNRRSCQRAINVRQ